MRLLKSSSLVSIFRSNAFIANDEAPMPRLTPVRIFAISRYLLYQFPNDIAVIFVIMRKINIWGKDGSLQRRFTR